MSSPFMYGRRTGGTAMSPSGVWYISTIGMRIRGLAATVLFSEWATTFLPFSSL
jgi:hypothetical protein